MASGDTLFILTPQSSSQVGSSMAPRTHLTGGTAYPEKVPVLEFANAADSYADWLLMMPNTYGGGGLTCRLVHSNTATANEVTWGLAFRTMVDDTEDIDAAHTYDFNTVDATVPDAAGEVAYDEITFTNGADMDNATSGSVVILRLMRDGDGGNDDNTGTAYLWALEVRET